MNYWIIIDNRHAGPFSAKQLVDTGLTPDTLVWSEGMTDWIRAANVPELIHLINLRDSGQPIPPSPDEAESQQPQQEQQNQKHTEPSQQQQPFYNWQQQQCCNQEPIQCNIPTEPCPPNYLVWSIIVTVLCCSILGIPAIVFSAMTKSAYSKGNIEKAKRYSEIAQWLIILSIVSGSIFGVMQIALFGII